MKKNKFLKNYNYLKNDEIDFLKKYKYRNYKDINKIKEVMIRTNKELNHQDLVIERKKQLIKIIKKRDNKKFLDGLK